MKVQGLQEIVEFTVPGRVAKVVDHAERLPRSQPRQFSIHSSQGRSVKTTPDTTSANYTADDTSDQAR